MITLETPGFTSTPLTKAIICVSLALSIVGKLFGIENMFVFDPASGLSLGKIVLSSVFVDTPNGIISISLFTYWLRTIERHMGTRKAAVVCVLSWTAYVALCVVEAFASSVFGVKLATTCGIHWYMFALLMLYARYIPEPKKVKVFNREFPAKRLLCLVVMHYSLLSFPHGLVGAVAGIVTGGLYARDAFGLTTVEVPERIADMFSFWAYPLFGMKRHVKNNNFHDSKIDSTNDNLMDQRPAPYEADLPPAAAGENNNDIEQVRNSDDDNVNDRGGGGEDNDNQQQNTLMNFLRGAEPNPHAVQVLVAMGFEEDLVKEALVMSNNDIDLAAARLLDNVQQ